MSWLSQKHDAVSMVAISVVLSAVTLAAIWEEIGYLVIVPALLIAPLGLFPAWFFWAWAMVSKGYLRPFSPAASIAVTLFVAPILWFAVLNLAQTRLILHPKAAILITLSLAYVAAFLLPQRRAD